jgi:nitrate/nitrite transporter NarK
VSFFVMFGFFFLFSLYLQFARGYSPLEAGLATLPFAVAFVIVSPRSAELAERIGSGRTIAYGFAIVGIGMVLMGLIGVDTPYLVLVVAMVLLSSGMAIVAAPATSGIMNAVPMSKAGVGSAVNDTTRELGGALGIAVFGSIVNSAFRSNIDLDGLGLSPSEVAEAEESIGAAAQTAEAVGGPAATGIVERAATAFTDAVNLASVISAVIVVASAVIVARTFTRAKETDAELAAATRLGAELEPATGELELAAAAD